MLLKVAPIDCALLALLQLIQPATLSDLRREAKDVAQLSTLRLDAFDAHFERLQADGYIFSAGNERFVASPKSYFLIQRSLSHQERDKARLLHLNRQRFR